jgi:hypothetical protein
MFLTAPTIIRARMAAMPPNAGCASHCIVTMFSGANPDNVGQIAHEDFAIADFTRVRFQHDGFECLLELTIFDYQLDFELRKKIDHVLGATVHLRVALLSAETFYLIDRQTSDADAL